MVDASNEAANLMRATVGRIVREQVRSVYRLIFKFVVRFN